MTGESTIPTPATPDVCTTAILVDGTQISGELQVLAIRVTRELNRIPTASIQFQDGEASKGTFKASDADLFVPGKSIEIQLGYRSQNTTVFKGIVTKQSIKIRKSGSVLNVECRHEAVKMTTGAQSRYFTDKKDSDILEDILAQHSLQKDVVATTPALKEVVQYDSSDWDFLLCRAEANGLVVRADDDKIVIAKPDVSQSAALTVTYGSTVLELDAEIDARWQSKSISATSWSPADQALVTADAKEPSVTASGNLSSDDLAKVFGGEALTLRHSGRLTEPELQAWADARLQMERLAKVRGRAKFQGSADVAPGKIVEVKGIGERYSGKMLVSGVRHTVSGGNWETDAEFGLNPESFAKTYELRPSEAAGLLPAVSGLQIGVVTALESDPDGEERIQVRLPLIDKAADGVWARLATLDAGNARGTYFRPEIDDEVICGFLNDDPRHPVVLGACHSSAHTAPEPGKDTNHLKGYVSREKLKFTFDDEKKVIGIETPGGNKLTFSDDAKGIVMQDQNGNKITLDTNGITIESAKDFVLKAKKDFKLQGTNAELSAQSSFKASGTGSAEVSGANTTIKGSAATVIQGGMVQIN